MEEDGPITYLTSPEMELVQETHSLQLEVMLMLSLEIITLFVLKEIEPDPIQLLYLRVEV